MMEFLILLIWLHEAVQTRQQAQFEKTSTSYFFSGIGHVSTTVLFEEKR